MPGYKIADDGADYEWASEYFVIWKSTKRIPKRPAICNSRCAILMVNKDYSHPIDDSEIPAHVSIFVHESKASTAPTNRPLRVCVQTLGIIRSSVGRLPHLF